MFRVWDKKTKYLDYDVRITSIDNYRKIKKIEVLDGFTDWREIKENDYILMRNTYLKDKHGNEIYEGDILKTRTRGLVKVKVENGNMVVTYKSGVNSRTTLTLSSFLDRYQVSIIGNIYENLELIDEVEE